MDSLAIQDRIYPNSKIGDDAYWDDIIQDRICILVIILGSHDIQGCVAHIPNLDLLLGSLEYLDYVHYIVFIQFQNRI